MDLLHTTLTSTLLNYNRVQIELSSKCTVKCPRCPRTELKPEHLNREITFHEFTRAFSPDVLQQLPCIVFGGDVGDPIYAKDFLEIVEYVKRVSLLTRIVITTNGSYKDAQWWTRLGLALTNRDVVTFSVDGWDQDSNEQYRVNSNFESIVAGARALRRSSMCVMHWSAIYFKFNEEHMDKIESLAKELGFDLVQRVRSTKFDGQYLIDGVDPLKPVHFYSKTNVYEKDFTYFNNVIPLETKYVKDCHPWARCINHEKEMFINVDGLVFPCPWFNSGYMENDFVQKHKERISIKRRPLEDILLDPVWEELVTRFETMPLDVCKIKCMK